MQMTNMIIDFRRYLKRRNYSMHTVKNYLSILREFVIWMDVPIEQLTSQKVEQYIDYLHGKQMQPASINIYVASIRAFYRFLRHERGVKMPNPFKAGYRLRIPRPLPRYLQEEHIDRLFHVIKGRRDRAMFTLMLRCGLRVNEVAGVNLGHIDLKRRTILVCNAKGGKERIVYLSDDARDALEAYLDTRTSSRIKKAFLVEKGTCKGQPISVRGIQKRMEYYAKKARLTACCHQLRHTMATQLLNAEAKIATIQDLLGHNWISTTQRYCKISNLAVQKDYHHAMGKIMGRSTQLSTHQGDTPWVVTDRQSFLDKHENLGQTKTM
jgi:site-specific recombinase XerD